ncbi:MAG: glycosyltransferase [Hyphomicrobiales bacterium]
MSSTPVDRENEEGGLPPGAGPLIVIGSLDVGGAEFHVTRIAPRLKALGWSPAVCCLNRRGALAASLEAEGIEVIDPPLERLMSSPFALVKGFAMTVSGIRLFGLLLARRPRIAHFFLPQAYLVGGLVSVLARVPVRVMSRRSLNVYKARHEFAWRLELRLHRHMTALLGNSRAVVRQLVEEEGCDPARTGLIYNGIDIAGYGDRVLGAALRRELGLGGDAFVMLIVANLIAYKGHMDLLEGLAAIRERLPGGWALLCAGRDDGCGDELRRRVSGLGLDGHVHFLGQREDVAALYAAADIGLLCSHQEGFSNAIIEGMASSIPMIVTDVGGNAEAIRHGDTGIVVPPSDPRALGSAILGLVNSSPSQRREMGARARARAQELFSLEACVAAYDRLYRSLLSRGPGSR